MLEMPCWYYDKKDLKNTPSFQNGIEPEVEARYRREGARFIINTGTKMGLRYDTMATGVIYFHRFYMFHSFKDFPRYVTACCCLFLAGKVEETPKKCKDIIKTARILLTDHQFAQFGEDPKEEVMTLERILLQTIKFDLQVDHPYSYLVRYAKRLKGDKQKLQKMVQMAWTFVNDSLCTTLSLQWEPEIVAIALMYLAGKLSKFEVVDWYGRSPKQSRWWDMFVEDISLDLLEDICHQVLDLYSPGGLDKNESPPATPPSQTPTSRPALLPTPGQQPTPGKQRNPKVEMPSNSFYPFPFLRTTFQQASPAQPLAAIPVQVGKPIKPDQHQLQAKLAEPKQPTAHSNKKLRLAAQPIPTVAETLPPQPPLPATPLPPPQPPPYTYPPAAPPNEHYAQYQATPPMPTGYQAPTNYQGYPPAETTQAQYEGDARYNQAHYTGSYDNSVYANYQPQGQNYYPVPQPPAYGAAGYQEAYPNEYNATAVPPPGYPPPPPPSGYPPQNSTYPLPAPYVPPRGGPPSVGQHVSPNPNCNIAPVRITGRSNRQNWPI